MFYCGIWVYMKRGATGESFMIFTLNMLNLRGRSLFMGGGQGRSQGGGLRGLEAAPLEFLRTKNLS